MGKVTGYISGAQARGAIHCLHCLTDGAGNLRQAVTVVVLELSGGAFCPGGASCPELGIVGRLRTEWKNSAGSKAVHHLVAVIDALLLFCIPLTLFTLFFFLFFFPFIIKLPRITYRVLMLYFETVRYPRQCASWPEQLKLLCPGKANGSFLQA